MSFNIDARTLRDKNVVRNMLKKEVLECLVEVKEKITQRHKNGKETAIVSLPIRFPRVPLKTPLCRLYVYSRVIEKLKEKGFEVQLEEKKETTVIHINWELESERYEWERMRKVLSKHRRPGSLGKKIVSN